MPRRRREAAWGRGSAGLPCVLVIGMPARCYETNGITMVQDVMALLEPLTAPETNAVHVAQNSSKLSPLLRRRGVSRPWRDPSLRAALGLAMAINALGTRRYMGWTSQWPWPASAALHTDELGHGRSFQAASQNQGLEPKMAN